MKDHPKDQQTATVFAVLVTSDTRTPETDTTGPHARKLIEEAGHTVKLTGIEPNDEQRIRSWLTEALRDPEVRVILTSGGTGIGAKDKTVGVAQELFEKTLPGFGEQFRQISYGEIGLSGLWSRAAAGVVKGNLVFCLPGSRGAVGTALEKLILPGVGHMLWELDRR